MILKVGSKGERVKRLQERLGLKSDGQFGPITESKVREWQSKNGLVADGTVGPEVWSRLFPETNTNKATTNTQNISLSLEKLKGHIPDSVLNQIPEAASKFNITTNLRLAHFLAQCAHESGNFTAVVENLNYSAEGLTRIFGKYFTNESAKTYARNPQRIASRVYASRMGNGNEQSGDGFKFRGRGYIQLTGKSNYEAFSRFIGENVVDNPDLVATKYPLASAAFFFNSNRLWTICDRGADTQTVTAVTRRVNGGTHGLQDRLDKFNLYNRLLNS